MSEELEAISKLIESWGYIVGIHGQADCLHVRPSIFSNDWHAFSENYVLIRNGNLIVYTRAFFRIVMSTPLASPDSLDRLKAAL